jgi:hypothetical protein
MELKQLVVIAVVSGGLGLSAVGLRIGMAHAEPTSPSRRRRRGPLSRPGLTSRRGLLTSPPSRFRWVR